MGAVDAFEEALRLVAGALGTADRRLDRQALVEVASEPANDLDAIRTAAATVDLIVGDLADALAGDDNGAVHGLIRSDGSHWRDREEPRLVDLLGDAYDETTAARVAHRILHAGLGTEAHRRKVGESRHAVRVSLALVAAPAGRSQA